MSIFNRRNPAQYVALAVLIVGGAFLWSQPAKAALGPMEVDSFTVSCGTSATEISAPSNRQFSYICQNNSTTGVFVGDNDITTSNAPQYCATNCASQEFGGNVAKEYCLVASGTVTVYCRAQVTEAP